MDVSQILTWAGLPFFLISFSINIKIRLKNRETFYPLSFLVLGLFENYCFLLSIVLRLAFLEDFNQQVLSQGVYSVLANLYFGFTVFILLDSMYDFYTIISNEVKLLIIITWIASAVLFGLIACKKFPFKFKIDSEVVSGYFFIDCMVLALSLAKLINILSNSSDIKDFRSFNSFGNFMFIIGCFTWAGSVGFDGFTKGPANILMNVGKAAVCVFGAIVSLYLVYLKKQNDVIVGPPRHKFIDDIDDIADRASIRPY